MEQVAYNRSYDEHEDLINSVYRAFKDRCQELPDETQTKRRLRHLIFLTIKDHTSSHAERFVLYHFFSDFFKAVESNDQAALAVLKQIIRDEKNY